MLVGKWILFMDVPERTAGNAASVGVDDLLPVARGILRVPGVQASGALSYSLLARIVRITMDGEEGVEEWLGRVLVRIEHASGNCRKISCRVGFEKFETHCRVCGSGL